MLPFSLSRISATNFQVEDAQGQEAPVQRLADAIAGPFVYSIMTLSAATFAFWYGVCFFKCINFRPTDFNEMLKIDGKDEILIFLLNIFM